MNSSSSSSSSISSSSSSSSSNRKRWQEEEEEEEEDVNSGCSNSRPVSHPRCIPHVMLMCKVYQLVSYH